MGSYLMKKYTKCQQPTCHNFVFSDCHKLPRFFCYFSYEVKECTWSRGVISYEVILYQKNANYSVVCSCFIFVCHFPRIFAFILLGNLQNAFIWNMYPHNSAYIWHVYNVYFYCFSFAYKKYNGNFLVNMLGQWNELE